jgi:Peptidase propeptide and YPEB domain
MLRPSASRRRIIGLAVAAAVGTGIGLGAYSLGAASGTDIPQFPRVGAATNTAFPTPADGSASPTPAEGSVPAPAEGSAPAPLTLEEATAVAAQVAPGRVVEWDEDHEPTGLRYDVKLLHDDGSTTDVEVDTLTGQVTSINHDNDGD